MDNQRSQAILSAVKDFMTNHSEIESPFFKWNTDYECVVLAIIEAFLAVELDEGVGFFEADCIDGYIDEESEEYQYWKQQDERKYWESYYYLWHNMQDPYPKHFHPFSAVSFMDEAGMLFSLPCYLLWEIEGYGVILTSMFERFAVLPLTPNQNNAFLQAVELLQQRAYEIDNDWEYDDWEKVKQILLKK